MEQQSSCFLNYELKEVMRQRFSLLLAYKLTMG